MPNFILVDDHPIVLSGLTALFRTYPQYHIIDSVASVEAALHSVRNLAQDAKCDMLIADLHLLGGTHEVIRNLRSEQPNLLILIFTETACPATCLAVMKAGANGFVLKDSTNEEILAAIEFVLSGGEFISAPLVAGVSEEKVLDRQRRHELASVALSSRESEVAHELLNGASNREIATKLSISYKTVKFYMNQIMRKFDVRNRLEVVLELQRMKSTPTPQGEEPHRASTALRRPAASAAPHPAAAPRPARSRLQ